MPVALAPEGPGRRASGVLVPIAVVLVITGLGWPLGRLWAALAPRVPVLKVDGGVIYAAAEPEEAVAADGWFLLLAVVVGIAVALVAWLALRRWRGPWMLVALVVGSLACAWLAWYTGTRLGYDAFQVWRTSAATGERNLLPLALRVTELDKDEPWTLVTSSPPWLRVNGVLAVQALAAAFVYTCCAGWSKYGSLREPDPWQVQEWQTHPGRDDERAGEPGQFGPGRTGSSDSGTGTALT
jgi:hypothetical protein